MRVALGWSLLVLVACGGGAPKPAETESSDTASLEPSNSQGGGHATAGSGATSGSDTPPSSGPAASAASSSPSQGTAGAASTESAASNGSVHPAPSSTGAIDGQPFAPKFAQVAGPVLKDGRRLVMLHEGTECAAPSDTTKPGSASMMLMVPWSDGYKVDLSSLKRAKKSDLGEAAFVRMASNSKKQVSTTFKPTGLLTVLSAPKQKDGVGKMKIDLQNGDYMLVGDLEINTCSATK